MVESADVTNPSPEVTPVSHDDAAKLIGQKREALEKGQPREPEQQPRQTTRQEPPEEGAESAGQEESVTEVEKEALGKFSLSDFASAIDSTPEEVLEALQVEAKVNGKSHAVTLKEAIAGYQLESDYRQKTQAIAEKSRAAEAAQTKAAQAAQMLEQRAQVLDDWVEHLRSVAGARYSPEQLAQLRHDDPVAWMEMKEQQRELEDTLASAQRQRQNVQREQQRLARDAYMQNRQRQAQALMSMSDFNTQEKVASFEKEMRPVLMEDYGYSSEEVDAFINNYEARQVPIVRDAIKYRQMMKTGEKQLKKRLEGKPKVTKPGPSSAGPQRSDAVQDIRDRLRKAKGRLSQHDVGADLIRAKRARMH